MVRAKVLWTLSSFYNLSRETIRDWVLAVVTTPGLTVADASLFVDVAVNYVAKNVDFIDAYNVAWIKSVGVPIAYTFDRKHFSRFGEVSVASSLVRLSDE